MEAIFLSMHIFGAILTAVAVAVSLLSIAKGKSVYFTKLIYTLTGGLIFQVFTGCMIELTSAHPALFLVFCSKILLYTGTILVTQLALLGKQHNSRMQLSYKYIIGSYLFAFVATAATGLFLR